MRISYRFLIQRRRATLFSSSSYKSPPPQTRAIHTYPPQVPTFRPIINPTHNPFSSNWAHTRVFPTRFIPNAVNYSTSVETRVNDKNFERIYVQGGLNVQQPLVIEKIDKDENAAVDESTRGKAIIDEVSEGGLNSRDESAVEKEALRLLQESVVTYCGSPVGTVAANDPFDTQPLNYDQVFIRDFVPSALAFLLKGDGEIVRNFLLHTLQLQAWIVLSYERITKESKMENSNQFAMVGGKGAYSYAINSQPQKNAITDSKLKLVTAIDNNLDVQNSSTIRIVDLGCSVGPNTFLAVNDIIEAIKHKYSDQISTRPSLPDFQVFFNDHVTNDFNALFTSLPPDRQYSAAGVPGSFHGRLFPESSLDFVYSSNSIHWLSSNPKEIQDPDSPSFNKGRIYYTNAPEAVGEAYTRQFAKDMESFLLARSQELVPGGLMVLLFGGRPNGTLPAKASFGPLYLPLERCLLQMANEGLISKKKIDEFNFPIYNPSLEELAPIIEKNGCFDAKEVESSIGVMAYPPVPYLPAQGLRAGFEGIIGGHFGHEVVDELFDRYANEIARLPSLTAADGLGHPLFIVLKRKAKAY